jgi:hypothetical protein
MHNFKLALLEGPYFVRLLKSFQDDFVHECLLHYGSAGPRREEVSQSFCSFDVAPASRRQRKTLEGDTI